MKILSIETSCDETAVALLEIKEFKKVTEVKILGNALLSQTAIHAPMGGVVPSLAKREHGKNLIPMLKQALLESDFLNKQHTTNNIKPKLKKIEKILEREGDLKKDFLEFIPKIQKPKIDVIAVTSGPGLEPALWVGINFAKALSLIWNKPIVAVNHMEGHVFSSLLMKKHVAQNANRKTLIAKRVADKTEKNFSDVTSYTLHATPFPLLSLLISGGHTELVSGKKFGSYKIIGETRDDAVGEAYDKAARMIGLPYPGGPEISKLAEKARKKNVLSEYSLPRPMINSKELDFSFAGLKTALFYTIKKNFKEKNTGGYDIPPISKMMLAKEFEDAVAEVLVSKVREAIEKTKAKTFAGGGGVIANKNIRAELAKLIEIEFPQVKLFLPSQDLTTDNAVMIAIAGYFKFKKTKSGSKKITANGNWRLG